MDVMTSRNGTYRKCSSKNAVDLDWNCKDDFPGRDAHSHHRPQREVISMLFAESSGSGIGTIIGVIILGLGLSKMSGWIKGSAPVRGAVKDGLLGVLGRMFKK